MMYVFSVEAEVYSKSFDVPTDQVVLYVITGKGLHSKGEARIKPAVISYLNSKAYRSANSIEQGGIIYYKVPSVIGQYNITFPPVNRFEELPGKLKVKLA